MIQGLNNTVMYYCGMRTSVLSRKVSFIQSVVNREAPLYSLSSEVVFLLSLHHGCGLNVVLYTVNSVPVR